MEVRDKIKSADMLLMGFISDRIRTFELLKGIRKIILAPFPNSSVIIRSVLKTGKHCIAPIKCTPRLNQVDYYGAFSQQTLSESPKVIRIFARIFCVASPVISAIDHCGSGLNENLRIKKLEYNKFPDSIKKSFEGSILAGYYPIHVGDASVLPLPQGPPIL